MSAIPEIVAGLLQPVRDEMARLTTLIDEAQGTLDDLRDQRRQLQRILTAADPQTKPGRKTNGGPPKPYAAQGISEDMIERVLGFLREHYPAGQGFNGTEVLRGWKAVGDAPSEIAIRTSISKLAERGQLRLAGRGKGGSSIYAIVAGGD